MNYFDDNVDTRRTGIIYVKIDPSLMQLVQSCHAICAFITKNKMDTLAVV